MLNEISGYSKKLQLYEDNIQKRWYEWLDCKSEFKKAGKQGVVGLLTMKEEGGKSESKSEKNGSKSASKNESENKSKCEKETDPDDKSDKKITKAIEFVYKFSQTISYLPMQEYLVSLDLNEISNYCPHFCRSYGLLMCDVDPVNNTLYNPLRKEKEGKDKYYIEKEVLLLEHIKHSHKLNTMIYSDILNRGVNAEKHEGSHAREASSKAREASLYSLILQVLLAIAIAQRQKKFTHYDLHSNNVLVKKCDPDLVMLYVLDEDNQFCVPTMGYYPIIIDYGFAYSEGIDNKDNKYFYSSLMQTDIGFMSDRFDMYADAKLFLITVSDEMHESLHNKRSKKFRSFVKKLYADLKVDFSSGWDDNTKEHVLGRVARNVEGAMSDHSKAMSDHSTIKSCSRFYKDYEYYVLEILQSLVELPLSEGNEKEKDKTGLYFNTFMKEFKKIEDEIVSPFLCLYILKGIVDLAREVKGDYMSVANAGAKHKTKVSVANEGFNQDVSVANADETNMTENPRDNRESALRHFKSGIYERVDSVSTYCRLKDVHFEKMLCSLYLMSKSLKGMFYENTRKEVQKRNKMYDRANIPSVEEICGKLDMMFFGGAKHRPFGYVFNQNTKVLVMDCVKKTTDIIDSEYLDCETLNTLENIYRGSILYDVYKKDK
jgi:hypothetical protein